ncbi:molybdopterin-containing oxidoreductase family protein [Candidatus Contubernalis alkaliaceticus]|uniref:molybdopterin-containing oxidoreductase family protein n=1 Tax=Candidatus Contubernalis alkaliaceticus TaxID=338645 RepID=UPI001F4C08F0|nr:molybdopterin-dependent oxidoreductase [Candidatus Contubernalis alkalaceticus]UNC90847.1 molybdopterin-dependent oxidoreductase [Candidatus Contubernalis alkalaceticus]
MSKNIEKKAVLSESIPGESFITSCEICNGLCSLNVLIRGEEIVRVSGRKEHSVSRGYICPKGMAVDEIINAPDRIKTPLIKKSGEEWQAVSPTDALTYIAERLNTIKEKYGAEALAVHVGRAGVRKEFTHYLKRFSAAFGSPNFSTAGSHCHLSKKMANEMTYGILPIPDFKNSSCIVLWGSNPAKSSPLLMRDINKAMQKGSRLLVIDPRNTSTTLKSDLHLQIRPGTDGALALAMLHVIIKNELYNKDFVKDWTIGFNQLVDLVVNYTPEKVESITWVPSEKIIEAAYLYAKNTPACISVGIALELQSNGFQTARAISILQAICGNLDVAGGVLFAPPAVLNSLKIEKDEAVSKPAIGQEEYPLFYKYNNNAQANIFARAILEGKPYPLKAMMVAGSNSVLTWPNAERVKRAFSSLEFLVVVENFMTETAKLADVVFPVNTFLSRDELCDFASLKGMPRLCLSPKIKEEPVMTDWELCKKLAVEMGLGKYFTWENEVEALNYRLKPLGISVEKLKQRLDEGYEYKVKEEKKYLKSGFSTSSGKVEIYSEELKEYGYDPLPFYNEPAESPVSTPQLYGEYPLILTSGARTMAYMHSRFHNIPSLRQLEPEPELEVHGDTANSLGIEDRELIFVESPRGRIQIRVKITDNILPGVISIPHGWDESNANNLTDDEALDPVSGFPPDRSFLARILKK